ncbi:MAG: 4Fe-4S binding protein [Desulfatiglandaceae bacterium]
MSKHSNRESSVIPHSVFPPPEVFQDQIHARGGQQQDDRFGDASDAGPVFDWNRCVRCGQCIRVCPTGTIGCGSRGYRLLIGGKLGRHPRLATEIEGIYDADQVLRAVKWCVRYYKQHSRNGERFAELVEKSGPAFFDLLTAEALHVSEADQDSRQS